MREADSREAPAYRAACEDAAGCRCYVLVRRAPIGSAADTLEDVSPGTSIGVRIDDTGQCISRCPESTEDWS